MKSAFAARSIGKWDGAWWPCARPRAGQAVTRTLTPGFALRGKSGADDGGNRPARQVTRGVFVKGSRRAVTVRVVPAGLRAADRLRPRPAGFLAPVRPRGPR